MSWGVNERWPEGWEIGFTSEVKRATINQIVPDVRCGVAYQKR
jgi:hypothetical protein